MWLPIISYANNSVSSIFVLHIDNVFYTFSENIYTKKDNNSEQQHIHIHLGAERLNADKNVNRSAMTHILYVREAHTHTHQIYTLSIHQLQSDENINKNTSIFRSNESMDTQLPYSTTSAR